MKYLVKMESGRTFVLNSGHDVYEVAHDDYLVDVIPIHDV